MTKTLNQAETKDMLAVGDADGHLHVMQLPKNLVRSSSKEVVMLCGTSGSVKSIVIRGTEVLVG